MAAATDDKAPRGRSNKPKGKAMLGPKVRRLRREWDLTQTQMAERLGISGSYLNLIEHNQRPVTVPLLLRLAQEFDVDLAGFAEDNDAELLAGVREMLADSLFEDSQVPVSELRESVAASPLFMRAILRLYHAHRELRDRAQGLAQSQASGDAAGGDVTALRLDEVRAFFHDHTNHFPSLETVAETLWDDAGLDQIDLFAGLVRHVDKAHGLAVRVLPVGVMGSVQRRLDRHNRRILLSEMLSLQGRVFHLAVQVAMLTAQAELDALADKGGASPFSSPQAKALARMGLANYLGGAVMMPYGPFLKAAREERYDLNILAARFGSSVEQVCHRLTTLQRPGDRGVPFFMIRLDEAGNISKRFSGGGFPLARFGGACPRWHVHRAFRDPDSIDAAVVELPDGARYLSVALCATKTGGGYHKPAQTYAIGLGCELRHASEVVYGDGLDLGPSPAAAPIGINCRLCDRVDCAQRAFPPMDHAVEVVDHMRGPVPYRIV